MAGTKQLGKHNGNGTTQRRKSIDPEDFKFPPKTPKTTTKPEMRPSSGFDSFERTVAGKITRHKARRRCIIGERASLLVPAMKPLELVATSASMKEPGVRQLNDEIISLDTARHQVKAEELLRTKDCHRVAGGSSIYSSPISKNICTAKDSLRPFIGQLALDGGRPQEGSHRQLVCSGQIPAGQIRPPSRSEQESVWLKRRNIAAF